MTNGDGLLLHGRMLYVLQNRDNKVSVVALAKGLASGKVARTITHPAFDVRRRSTGTESACTPSMLGSARRQARTT